MSKIKSRNIFAVHAWNKRGAGKHIDKKWYNKNRRRGKVNDDE
jgi:hypothetical protein